MVWALYPLVLLSDGISRLLSRGQHRKRMTREELWPRPRSASTRVCSGTQEAHINQESAVSGKHPCARHFYAACGADGFSAGSDRG
jgi:hypothetical protein